MSGSQAEGEPLESLYRVIMQDLPQAQFNGWAKVEVMGHQSHVGYVKTEAYGAAVLFRIDTPALPERQYELTEPAHMGGRWCPVGTKVKRQASPGVSVLVGAGSIYRIIPCSEAAAMKAIEAGVRSELCAVDVPQLAAPAEEPDGDDPDEFFDDDGDQGGEEARFFSPAVSSLTP